MPRILELPVADLPPDQDAWIAVDATDPTIGTIRLSLATWAALLQHGNLGNLESDDHPQYLTAERVQAQLQIIDGGSFNGA